MNEVCYSAKDAFEKRFNKVKYACEAYRVAIYGSADWKQDIIISAGNAKTQQKLSNPNCESGLIYESEISEGKTVRDGSFLMKSYILLSDNKDEILKKFDKANRDELLLFMVLANPTLLNDNEIQDAFFNRVSTIHEQEGATEEAQRREVSDYSKFFKCFKGAHKDPVVAHSYFPKEREIEK